MSNLPRHVLLRQWNTHNKHVFEGPPQEPNAVLLSVDNMAGACLSLVLKR